MAAKRARGTAKTVKNGVAKKASAEKASAEKASAEKASAEKASPKKASAKKASPKKPRPASARRTKPAATRPARGHTSALAGQPADALLEPTLRVYAEEEARILRLASSHPSLGAAFVHAMAKSDAAIPSEYRAAFRAAMKGVDVEARVRAVIASLEERWGTSLDAATKAEVRADVRAMYRGEGA